MDIASVVANLGFPIGIAVYLLTRFEKKMDNLENSITGKDGILDKLDDVKEALKENKRAVKANYVGKVRGEKYV
jgi:hypothetical protein